MKNIYNRNEKPEILTKLKKYNFIEKHFNDSRKCFRIIHSFASISFFIFQLNCYSKKNETKYKSIKNRII